MNSFAAESAACAIRDLGKDLTADGHALYLSLRRKPDADELAKRVATIRKLTADVDRAATALLLAVGESTEVT